MRNKGVLMRNARINMSHRIFGYRGRAGIEERGRRNEWWFEAVYVREISNRRGREAEIVYIIR